MLQKISIKFQDNIFLILLGITIAIFPICFLMGSLLINLNTLFICIIFVIFVFKEKKFNIFKNKFFLALLILWLSFFVNLIFSSNFDNSFLRTFGFLRFILLTLSIKLFLENSSQELKTLIFKIWLIIFSIISLDLIFEYIFGFNTLGFSSYMPGRLSGFLNQELKIGHLYSATFLICVASSFYISKKKYIIFLLIFSAIILSLLIGERSNFIRVFLMSVFFILFFQEIKLYQKLLTFILIILLSFVIIYSNKEYKKRFYGQFINPIIKTKNINKIINNTVYGANFDRAKRIYQQNKIFGVGIKNFRNESNKTKYQNKELIFNLQGASTHPHQIHLEILSETGLFGYFIFLSFILFSIFTGFKNYLKSNNLITLSSTLYFLFSLMPILPSGSFFTTFGATLLWINYGFMISNYK